MSDVTYTVCVTPGFTSDLVPYYEFFVYRMVPAGVCGPFSPTYLASSLEEVDSILAEVGYKRKDSFGNLCANGFAEAPIVKVGA